MPLKWKILILSVLFFSPPRATGVLIFFQSASAWVCLIIHITSTWHLLESTLKHSVLQENCRHRLLSPMSLVEHPYQYFFFSLAPFFFFFLSLHPQAAALFHQRLGFCMRAAAPGAPDCFGREVVPWWALHGDYCSFSYMINESLGHRKSSLLQYFSLLRLGQHWTVKRLAVSGAVQGWLPSGTGRVLMSY